MYFQEPLQEVLVSLGLLPRSRLRWAASRALRGPRKEAVLLLNDLLEPAAVVLVIQLPADVFDGPANRMPANHTLIRVQLHRRAAQASAPDAPGRRARRRQGCQDSIGRHGRGPSGRPHALGVLRSQCLAMIRQDRLSRGSGGINSTGECHAGMRMALGTSGAVRWVGRGV